MKIVAHIIVALPLIEQWYVHDSLYHNGSIRYAVGFANESGKIERNKGKVY